MSCAESNSQVSALFSCESTVESVLPKGEKGTAVGCIPTSMGSARWKGATMLSGYGMTVTFPVSSTKGLIVPVERISFRRTINTSILHENSQSLASTWRATASIAASRSSSDDFLAISRFDVGLREQNPIKRLSGNGVGVCLHICKVGGVGSDWRGFGGARAGRTRTAAAVARCGRPPA